MISLFIYLFFSSLTINDFVCTNGLDPRIMTTKEYLIEFSKGPCSPFIIIPPLTGSKLVVKIDCEKLREKNPQIFKTCGWTTCDKNDNLESSESRPKTEYKLWISDFESPIAFLTLYPEVSLCFSRFFGILPEQMDSDNPIEDFGYDVVTYGETEETNTAGDCGN